MNNTRIQDGIIIFDKSKIISIVGYNQSLRSELVSAHMDVKIHRDITKVRITFYIVVVVDDWNSLKESFFIKRSEILNCVSVPAGFKKKVGVLNVDYKEKSEYSIKNSVDIHKTILINSEGYVISGNADIIITEAKNE